MLPHIDWVHVQLCCNTICFLCMNAFSGSLHTLLLLILCGECVCVCGLVYPRACWSYRSLSDFNCWVFIDYQCFIVKCGRACTLSKHWEFAKNYQRNCFQRELQRKQYTCHAAIVHRSTWLPQRQSSLIACSKAGCGCACVGPSGCTTMKSAGMSGRLRSHIRIQPGRRSGTA